MPNLRSLILLIALLASPTALAADGWERMTFQDLTRPGPNAGKVIDIWSDLIAKNNREWTNPLHDARYNRMAPAQAISAFIPARGKLIIVSIFSALAAHCDNGENSSTAALQPSKCPARIVTIGNAAPPPIQIPQTCFIGFLEDDRTAPEKSSYGVFVKYIEAENAISMKTIVNNVELPECAATFQLH